MIGASSQAGDTLVTCHFPVMRSWQIQALCSSVKRSTAGLTRAVSLPERDSLNRDHDFNGVRRHFSSSYSSLAEERTEEEGNSDSSGRYEPCSSPEDSSSQLRSKACVRSHNSFLPNSEMDEDEEDEDSDGDNLHRYCEDSSFVLHGNTNWPVTNSVRHLIRDNSWGNEGNVSDGVLVNFCAIYNRSNNPATPLDLSSPTLESAQGSVFLNLLPVPLSPQQDLRAEALDSNCNLYTVEPLPAGLTSLEASDLNACLQSQAALPVGTNQKYYKLVSCDLSSQSPSPAWSSCPVGQSKSSSPSEGQTQDQLKKIRVEEHVEEGLSTPEFPVASTSTAACWRKHLLHTACSLSCSQSGPQGSKCQGTSTETTRPSARLDRDHSDDRGLCSGQTPLVRFTKAQRPTSLPIQPFVLVPTEKPPARSELLGGLLEQYIHQKNRVSSQPSFTFRGKRSQCFTNMQLSPMGSQCPIFLEAPSSSDTCSTCTPSPDCFRHVWSRSGASSSMLQPSSKLTYDQTSPYSDKDVVLAPPSRTLLTKIPTYRNLIHLTPEQQDNQLNRSKCSSSSSSVCTLTPPTLPLTDDQPSQVSLTPPSPLSGQNNVTHYRAAPVCGFMRSTLSAAVSSVAPLSSLLRSWTSHGFSLLRAVSRAVDLIMAHFGSSRDPEEKLRLGDSSRSPTIAGLVLEHLCPSIQNILEDGLRDHKLDPIIGQRPTHSWRVVEVSTKIVLNCLVSKIKQYPQLTDHCMRLRAFIMGLLNLRSLEFWLSHLNNQKDVVTTHYHSWGFLSMSLGRCQPLFQELLLTLQPLSVLPFDLNLLLEPRLFCQNDSNQSASPSAPSSGLLATSWPLLQGETWNQSTASQVPKLPSHVSARVSSSLFASPAAQWWAREAEEQTVDGLVEAGEDCCVDEAADHWSQVSMESRQEEEQQQRNTPDQSQSQCESGLRWAKLFGAADLSTSAVGDQQSHVRQRRRFNKRPSDWLHLDRDTLGLLAQSFMKL
ncbi:hypothetical protein WMY93_021612 [Mugilogobius chulae]|uniref:RUN domain-containing protein n=1 Tax=Mugilogobius chulae TaxID=88201 RepID=A0AAW0NB50_9GOBI